MVEMFDPMLMNGYMIQVRLQAFTEPLADLGYDNDLILEDYGKKEIRIYKEDVNKTYVIDYAIIFDEDDNDLATGFTLRLHRLDGKQLQVTDKSSSGPIIASRQEKLALNNLEAVDWIEEQIKGDL